MNESTQSSIILENTIEDDESNESKKTCKIYRDYLACKTVYFIYNYLSTNKPITIENIRDNIKNIEGYGAFCLDLSMIEFYEKFLLDYKNFNDNIFNRFNPVSTNVFSLYRIIFDYIRNNNNHYLPYLIKEYGNRFTEFDIRYIYTVFTTINDDCDSYFNIIKKEEENIQRSVLKLQNKFKTNKKNKLIEDYEKKVKQESEDYFLNLKEKQNIPAIPRVRKSTTAPMKNKITKTNYTTKNLNTSSNFSSQPEIPDTSFFTGSESIPDSQISKGPVSNMFDISEENKLTQPKIPIFRGYAKPIKNVTKTTGLPHTEELLETSSFSTELETNAQDKKKIIKKEKKNPTISDVSKEPIQQRYPSISPETNTPQHISYKELPFEITSFKEKIPQKRSYYTANSKQGIKNLTDNRPKIPIPRKFKNAPIKNKFTDPTHTEELLKTSSFSTEIIPSIPIKPKPFLKKKKFPIMSSLSNDPIPKKQLSISPKISTTQFIPNNLSYDISEFKEKLTLPFTLPQKKNEYPLKLKTGTRYNLSPTLSNSRHFSIETSQKTSNANILLYCHCINDHNILFNNNNKNIEINNVTDYNIYYLEIGSYCKQEIEKNQLHDLSELQELNNTVQFESIFLIGCPILYMYNIDDEEVSSKKLWEDIMSDIVYNSLKEYGSIYIPLNVNTDTKIVFGTNKTVDEILQRVTSLVNETQNSYFVHLTYSPLKYSIVKKDITYKKNAHIMLTKMSEENVNKFNKKMRKCKM